MLLDSQTVFWEKPTCVNIIMKLDALWVLVTLSTILGFFFFWFTYLDPHLQNYEKVFEES